MKYMLDTNICIYLIKRRPPTVLRRLIEHDPEDICISSITYAEMMHGVEKSQAKEQNRAAYLMFLSTIAVLDFDTSSAEEYGRIRANLETQGKPIGPMDMLIASHAKAQNLILVTNNTREFDRVEGLQLENWVQSAS